MNAEIYFKEKVEKSYFHIFISIIFIIFIYFHNNIYIFAIFAKDKNIKTLAKTRASKKLLKFQKKIDFFSHHDFRCCCLNSNLKNSGNIF